ncbi:pericentrin isoform X3 [Carettochelys insculpta]|uniref:pericentrin isoform X3 n=1 Tax=Carettochelys insculpta TaxID=44489 RepID=UPI003EBC5C06
MDEEERRRKLEAGRARFAHFRQRKTKSDNMQSQKKAAKRKGSSDQTHDIPKEEGMIAAQDPAVLTDLNISMKSVSEETETIFESEKDFLYVEEYDQLDAQMCQNRIGELEKRLLDKREALKRLTEEVDDLLKQLAQLNGATHLQNTKDKECLLAQMEDSLNTTVQQMCSNIGEKDETIKGLQDIIALERSNLSLLQRTLSLRDAQIMELKDEIASAKMNEQECIEELKANHKRDICRQLQDLRTELEECHRKEIVRVKEICEEEMNKKYQNELDHIKRELSALNSGEDFQNSNTIIDLNSKLHESEIQRDNLWKHLKNQMEDFQRERSEIEQRYNNLVEDLKLQLNDAEKQAKEAQETKQEKEHLNDEIQKLNSFIQELSEKLLLETKNNKDLKHKHEEEIAIYNLKLKKLEQEEKMLQEVSESQKAELEKMQIKLCQHEGEIQLVREELECQHGLRMDSFKSELEDTKKNVKNAKTRQDHESYETGNIFEENIVEFGSFIDESDILAKYLVSSEQQGQSHISDSSRLLDAEEDRLERFVLESNIILEPNLESTADKLMFGPGEQNCFNSVLQGTSDETELEAEAFASYLSGVSVLQKEIKEVKDEERDGLMERCVELIKQLSEKESALNTSYRETQEVVEKWEKATAELSMTRIELNKERDARIRCEEELDQKVQKEKELENKINFLEKQSEDRQLTVGIEELGLGIKVSKSHTWQEMIKDLKQERETLMMHLRAQEQLVKEVQEQKTASDSVTSEVQSLFGRQLAVLQSQRDQMQVQLDAEKAKNQTIAELLGQKTILEETLLKEQKALKAEISNKEQNLTLTLRENLTLQERLSAVEQNLIKAEKAFEENLEKNRYDLNMKMKNFEKALESERLGFEEKLKSKNLELQKLNTEMQAKKMEYVEKENKLIEEVASLKKIQEELENHLQETVQKSAQAVQEVQSEMKQYEEEISRMESQHLSEITEMNLVHQKEIEELNVEIKEKVEEQQKLEEERKEQIGLIKKVHEREHDREIAELITKHEDEMKELRAELIKEQQQLLDELQQEIEARHKAEMQHAQLQSQTVHNLELEALRLSLTNMHTSQLELIQSNFRKEKETALVELREMLNDKRAQEIAILQSRHQFELEHIKEQNLKEKEEIALKYEQELDDERKKIELEMEKKHMQTLETLKEDWTLKTETCLKDIHEELSEKHRTEICELQKTLKLELESVKEELKSLSLKKEQVEMKCKKLENEHKMAITKLREQLQVEHDACLEDLKLRRKEREQEMQQEMEKLQAAYEELKTRSQEEVKQLWSQLDTARASRQELSELKEQLLARTSHVDEIERLKQEFEQQQQQQRSEHETELEQLRIYFEEKLGAAEENYREELTLLHQRMQELKECSLLDSEFSQDQHLDISSSVTLLEEASEEERRDLLDQLTQQLEQHKEELSCLRLQLEEKHRCEIDSLRSSLALQYKEDLMKMKMDLSDRYISEIEELKKKHCLDLEQLRAKLSEEHIRDITKLRLQSAQDAARQIEAEVAERVCMLENEHKAKLSLFQSEEQHIVELQGQIQHLKREITKLKDEGVQHETHLKEEMEKIKCRLVDEHKDELRRAREVVRQMEQMQKEKEEEWKCEREALRIKAEEKLSMLRTELEDKAELEKQNLQKEFKVREAEMSQLQDQQAARIVELEKSLKEQQNTLRQLEDSLASMQTTQKAQAQYDSDLQAAKAFMEKKLEKTTFELKEECSVKLMEAQNKFMEEHKVMTQKFRTEQEFLLQELKGKHADELELQSQQLQEKHKQQISSLTAELQTKHQAEIETLKSALQSKEQAKLEAHIVELKAKHLAQIDELEEKHLSNLDSLESSYLSEIQIIRDEQKQAIEDLQMHFTEQLHEKDKANQTILTQEIERLKLKHAEELQHSQDNLKIELATIHIEKLKAMAAELEEAHKEDLNTALQNQRCMLEEENHKALKLLREEVLQMEEHHQKALKELQDLHMAEVQKQKEEYSRQMQEELEKLKAQHEHEQEMYASASASEVETVRAALLAEFEELKLKQQLQFQDEIELLKCQSEVLLEQQIAQLKEEFETERKTALYSKEQVLIQETEVTKAHEKERELSVQIQEKKNIIIQLENKVESLNSELEETKSELETLLQRRDRENQEGENLVAMLRSDIELTENERKKLQESYQRVMKLFVEILKAAIAIEDLICKKIGLCLDDSLASGDSRGSRSMMEEVGFLHHFKAREKYDLDTIHFICLVGNLLDETLTEHNQVSAVTDEGSELSQHLCESVFASPDLEFENEEMILKICHRLRTAVEKLLEMVTESTKQLEKTHKIHAHFEEEFSRRNQETAQVVSQHHELMECLNEESEAKNHLALELHKAEGIIEGYVAEKAALEETLNLKEESEHRLVVELESLQKRFQELTQEQAILCEERDMLISQKKALAANLGEVEVGLLKEVEFLAKEKLELQCQAEKDHSSLRSQIKVLEMELEEQMHQNQMLAKKSLEVTDLRQQIQVLERQLRNQRQFMDEQAIEREHERDEFQQEIQKLEEQLKISGKSQTSGEPRQCGIESLQEEIKEKTEDYNKLLLEKEQKYQEVTYGEKEIEQLEARVRELECTNTEASKTVSCLEQELQKMKKMETELKQDKEALQQQQYNNLIQISALQSKLDEARHRVPPESSPHHGLKEQLQAEQEALLIKDREILSLLEQVEQLKENLINKNEEILQLNLQLETQKKLTTGIDQLQVENARLKEDVAKLRIMQSQNWGKSKSAVLQFPQALLEEKNQEIDHLNEQIERLQQELDGARVIKVMENGKSEIDELRLLVEHLRGDQERLQRDKAEEVEQLHEVIEKLQKELVQLGPNCHEVTDSQDNLNLLRWEEQAENLHDELKKGSLDLQEHSEKNKKTLLLHSNLKEIQEELELVSTAREALQQLLEEKEAQFKMEIEILEENLQSSQESSRQYFAELTSLRIQYDALQEEYNFLTTHLSQRDGEMGIMSTRIQELEDTLRAREATLLERDQQIKTAAEWRVVETAELQHLREKVAKLEGELLKKDVCQEIEAEKIQTLQLEVSRLDFRVQTLNQKEVIYQREIDELKANGTKLKDQIQDYLKELNALCSERDDLYSQLKSYKEKEENNAQETKLHSLLSKQDREIQVQAKGMEKLGEEMGINTDQSFAVAVSQSDKSILVQLQATDASDNHEDLITKMTLHREELKSELAFVKKKLDLSEEQMGKFLEDIKEKDAAIADLKAHSGNLKIQIKQLQETLLLQEAEMTSKARELQDLKKHCQQILEFHQTPDLMKCKLNNLSQDTELTRDTLKDFEGLVMDMTLFDSPEIVRKQETSTEVQPSLHLTPFSEVDSVHSTDFEMMHNKSAIQGETPELLGYPTLHADISEKVAARLVSKSPAFSGSTYSIAEYQDVEKRILVRDVDDFTLTPCNSQDDLGSTMSGLEVASDGCGSNSSSDMAAKVNQELETAEHVDASFMAYLQYCGIFQDAVGDPLKEKETISPQLKSVLKMVYEDSRRILALSEHPFPLSDQKSGQQSAAAEGWQKEELALLDAIQSLKDYLSKGADRGDKDSSDTCFDWRGELLQAVQSALEKERNVFHIDLQSHFCNPGSGDEGSVVEKLEHVVKRQEEQQRIVLEHLLSSDRNSLLSEIQDLRAQLRMIHLQNQEKLQQLQETLTNAEDHGSKQEHQLRRKVELLEYKLQQEKAISSDLQNSLSGEQERASEMYEFLKQERSAVSDMKSELYESKQENEHLQKSLQELQKEIKPLRCELENKEKDLTVALQDLQNEQLKEKELQNMFEEQHLQHKLRDDERTKALEELQSALELQCIQNNKVSVALEHEKSANDNLRKELQIEHSRCEALLSQERNKLVELHRNLEVEKNHSLELLNALNHERVLTEQLSMRVNEDASCKHKASLLEQSFVKELQSQLDDERSRAMELAAIIEKTHQQAIQSKRQLEAEVQICCEETQKEREVSTKLRAALQSLQSQKREVIHSLEVQREREAKLKADWEQLQTLFRTMKEQEKSKKEERDKERKHEQRSESEKRKEWQKDKEERLHELELQHERDENKMKLLQQTLAELEEQERNLASSHKSQRELPLCPTNSDYNASLSIATEAETLHLQQQQLEKIRQQLLFAAVHLNEFIYKTVDKTVNDWSASNDEAIASLLHTLKELKSELLTSSTPLKPVQGSISLVDMLLKENGELTKSVTILTEEKLELRAAISQLEKTLQQRGIDNKRIQSSDDVPSVHVSERASWQREKTVLQNALKQAESELAKATAEIENKPVLETSNQKMQKLYRKYLRAESFRKALVYQKKYLLLLLGGFQDCEQATLSLIARMGVYPSPADLQVSESRSRPFTKFRSVVRVVIAVSRLKFLVKKWHKVNRKGTQGENISYSIGHKPGARIEVLRQQQFPSVNVNSPPTRDIGSCYRTTSARFVSHSPKSSYWLHNRLHPPTSSASEKSLLSTQDPERSLTEYIHRLEVIQQRLGGVQKGNTPGPPHQRT